MVKLLRLLLGLAALIVILAFAIANRGPVDIGLAPLPGAIEVPVYAVFLFGLVVGVLVGGCGVWLSGFRLRSEGRRMRNKVWALQNQIDVLKQQEEKARSSRPSAPQPRAPQPRALQHASG
jgi:uncharacterized integral membrane protein